MVRNLNRLVWAYAFVMYVVIDALLLLIVPPFGHIHPSLVTAVSSVLSPYYGTLGIVIPLGNVLLIFILGVFVAKNIVFFVIYGVSSKIPVQDDRISYTLAIIIGSVGTLFAAHYISYIFHIH